MRVSEYYDALIDAQNDPVNDPEPLREYMDGWDGQAFFDELVLDKRLSVLEVGVGTGRLAVKAAPLCGRLCGIDISPKTAERAKIHLAPFFNAEVICADFMTYGFEEDFDRIYSSLTLMHIKDKAECLHRMVALLKRDGKLVLSIDKSKAERIDFGEFGIEVYPDDPEYIAGLIEKSGLELVRITETAFAYILSAKK
ncbi:MAG: class I SAM-dependent methyltransferase [Clostridia bacterium]|nr:class I SAM-dependent methyltransferase [Clostridia bacterium]